MLIVVLIGSLLLFSIPMYCSWPGGKKGGKGKGGRGGGRGVRGVDFGLGIGYNPESANASQTSVTPSRSAAVNSLRNGMMAQFRSNFVAAASNSQGDAYKPSRPVLPGFVSGGSIGGDAYKAPQATSFSAATGRIAQNGNQRKPER
ncbi:hypothetical protein HPP92_001081 [Vanilla planifolia]|uniref:Uncharacterized protein n=1 Tax=Vanilla planifolia TaxID=51239 RepID=A0A835VHN0_VANPL|nr:hypothetical protein HPP92_001081 [Vanilla planifolia]